MPDTPTDRPRGGEPTDGAPLAAAIGAGFEAGLRRRNSKRPKRSSILPEPPRPTPPEPKPKPTRGGRSH